MKNIDTYINEVFKLRDDTKINVNKYQQFVVEYIKQHDPEVLKLTVNAGVITSILKAKIETFNETHLTQKEIDRLKHDFDNDVMTILKKYRQYYITNNDKICDDFYKKFNIDDELTHTFCSEEKDSSYVTIFYVAQPEFMLVFCMCTEYFKTNNPVTEIITVFAFN